MQVTIGWTHLIALVGALQGLLLAGVLLAQRSNRTANRLLAALMAAFTMFLLATVYYATGLIRLYPHFFALSYPTPWLFGPLVYLYALAASDRSWRFRRPDAIHFVPAAVAIIVLLPTFVKSAPDKIVAYDQMRVGHLPTLLAIIDPFKFVSGLVYSVATVAYLRQHGRRIENSYSNTERVNLHWLLWLAGAAGAIWVLAASMKVAGYGPRSRDDLISLAMALLVYSIGYIGLRQPEIFRFDGASDRTPIPPTESVPEIVAPADARYQRSGLGDTEAAQLKTSLLALMATEYPYRDPDLTLAGLAEQLDTTPHKLSEVLNVELSQTFYDFVNGYRVSDVRRRLAESKSKELNVLTLAMDAGFASKSTFNQVFKKRTGQTPSTYRKALAG